MGKQLFSSGGSIGLALAENFSAREDVEKVVFAWHSEPPAMNNPKIDTRQLDLTNDAAVDDTLSSLSQLDGVINCAGFLHGGSEGPEKTIARATPEFLLKNIERNTVPTMLLAKHSHGLLRKSRDAFVAAISARVGSIEENGLGGWYSYRASKAALNMLLKTLSIEWQRALPRCTVAALHPGTVVSKLSDPFTGNIATEKLFTPVQSAAYMVKVIDNLTPEKTGRFWSWDGSQLPW